MWALAKFIIGNNFDLKQVKKLFTAEKYRKKLVWNTNIKKLINQWLKLVG